MHFYYINKHILLSDSTIHVKVGSNPKSTSSYQMLQLLRAVYQCMSVMEIIKSIKHMNTKVGLVKNYIFFLFIDGTIIHVNLQQPESTSS